ncbi:MlaD family protein [Conexibacter sp. JD483]|uniref:MlaD family protein n=1 Tax=unclassified Conexibacter TaxID=2627773 RepID=UPI002719B837|nr:MULTISPECIES: MlaD family protein [unclassified Conexibacter]MDO8186152.1 MlaD family protein [Conexibacter sp. CPCC 205706]MDO8199642.1 MlaD family protein [Conexibacter sp. CPCC 205762]MDR9369104.1 MlaD family protein [Conexibacter sp. JD483]
MKRLLAITAVIVAALVVLVVGTGARSDSSYKVRAIFDNAGFLVPGEDVKASGVVIGTISALEVTPQKKAAVVLEITDPAFKDFKQDATCAVRLQSLLGEKYVACEPTQPRNEGERPAPSLRRIRDGPGKGEYLLPISRTQSSVDLDMLNNVMQVPERERLALIINELGTGLAGNGEELRAAIRRANPALDNFDKFLKVLADENQTLAKLAEDSDLDLSPLARERESITRFIDKAGATATATAEKGDALERNFELLPQFLTELRPTMQRLQGFTEAATPVFEDLGAAAPSINQLFAQLGPFSEAALPTFRTLGDAAEISRRALVAARPVIRDLNQLATAVGPLGNQFATGLRSLRSEYGIQNFMRTTLGFSGALNGYDSVSHYARVYALLTICLREAVEPNISCSTGWDRRQAAAGASASASTLDSGASETGADASSGLTLPTVALPTAAAPKATTGAAGAAADGVADTGTGDEQSALGSASGDGEDPRAGVLGYLLGTETVR